MTFIYIYPAFIHIRYPAGYPVILPDIWLEKKCYKLKQKKQLQQNIYQRNCLFTKSGPILYDE